MVGLLEILDRVRFWRESDRLGPDMLSTHWRLYFKSTMRELCLKKFKHFGHGAEFRPGAYAEACSKISIGQQVVIRPGTFLFADPTPRGGEIVIEDEVLIGCGVHCYTNNHAFSDPAKTIYKQGYPTPTPSDSVVLRKGCWIGAGVILLPGVEIGENAVVGAGAVVTKSIPAFTVVAGNPARAIREIVKKDTQT